MRASAKQAQIEREIERNRLAMTTSPIAELFTRAQAKIQQAQARTRLMAQIRETAELLEIAADASDDVALKRRFLDGRDRLRERALDPRLGL